MEENKTIEEIDVAEYYKQLEDFNKHLIDEMMKTCAVPKTAFAFDSERYWNTMNNEESTRRFYEAIENMSKEISKHSLKRVAANFINKDLCYLMKKCGSIRRFKKEAKKNGGVLDCNVYQPLRFVRFFKALNKAENKNQRRRAKNGIKRVFGFSFLGENEFAVKPIDKDFTFANGIGCLGGTSFDYETSGLSLDGYFAENQNVIKDFIQKH